MHPFKRFMEKNIESYEKLSIRAVREIIKVLNLFHP
jgi:hypothetical protein